MARAKHASNKQIMIKKEIKAHIQIERIFLTKLEFETKNLRQGFDMKWRPKVGVEMTVSNTEIDDSEYEVSLEVKLDVALGSLDIFTVDVIQSGVFNVEDSPARQSILAAECPTILFPYAREAIDNVVIKATLPAIALAPINFREVVQRAMDENEPAVPRYTKPIVN